MIKLNDNNIFVGQIKQLLHTFPLPQCQIGGIYPVANTHFLLRDHIKRWDKDLNAISCEHYVFGNDYLNLTSTFPIRNMLYDRETHRYLGKYLRFLRDYSNINLMSMYNCCDGELNTCDISFTLDKNLTAKKQISFLNGVDGCNVYKIPVSISPFTISTHSLDTLEICVYIDNLNESYKKIINNIAKSTYIKRKSNSVINYSPFANIKNNTPESNFILSHMHELYLLIKVSSALNTSLTVLEGTYKYTDKSYQKYFSYKPLLTEGLEEEYVSLLAAVNQSIQDAQSNIIYSEKLYDLKCNPLLAKNIKIKYGDICESGFNVIPQLLSNKNTQSNGLLADRLIEYLTGNAITPLSEYYDIKRMQLVLDNIRSFKSKIPNIDIYQKKYKTALIKSNLKSPDRYLGIWNNQDYLDLKSIAYSSRAMEEYDTLGYLDKTLEEKLKGAIDNVNV